MHVAWHHVRMAVNVWLIILGLPVCVPKGLVETDVNKVSTIYQ